MATLTQDEFEKQKIEPAVARLGEVADEITAAEDELEALVEASSYDNAKADKVELKIASLRREQARLERRVRSLSRRLGHVSGTAKGIEV